ncbi:FAD-dependent oxidoreductase [Rubrivirga sp. S365]|uniref:FAD-dependent oxidoreductase n=1 Tax=Rubrivirga sp. S365 TaxID=3076080 RepID=UPI0028C815B5|nr:FAD-dependent oxidoreductase [Rubrivirga sp. S365]MDT7856955.1 FAD-dependent oxidoreductase [Rubrivirga sp. S365]
MDNVDVAVVGGGVAGLGVAWRLAQRGRRVALFERGRAGRGASWAAAGMLAPDAEAGFEELDLYALGHESLARWPAFAAEVEAASGRGVGYRTDGTFVVADDRDAARALRRLFRFQTEHGAAVEWLTGDEAAEREPLLSPRLPAAVWSPDGHQVDNRALVDALRVAAEGAGVEVHEGAHVTAVEPGGSRPGDRPALSVTREPGGADSGESEPGGAERVEAGVVVLAAGAWSGAVGGLTPAPPVRPVKGQALSLRMTDALTLRHVVRGPDAYLVPKADGRLVVGGTSEERGWDAAVTAGGLFRLLEGAVPLVPAVEEMELVETWVGHRPASRDHGPLLGRSEHAGVVYATGQYRHGVLLAPVVADEVAAEVDALLEAGGAGWGGEAETRPLLAPFSPRRFR